MGTAVKLYLGLILTKQVVKLSKKEDKRKKKLSDYFGEKILVLQTHTNIPNVIINASGLSDQFTMKDDCGLTVTTTAKYIESNIKNYCNKLPPLKWSSNIEELMNGERMPPTSVILFLKNSLKQSKEIVSAKKMRLIES